MSKDSSITRITILSGLILLVYTSIIFKLHNEQVSSSEEHRKKISEQSIRQIRLPSVRGRILTSDAKHIIADNKVSFNIVFHLEEMRQPGKRQKTLDFIIDSSIRIAQIIGRKNKATEKDVIHHMNYYPGLPMAVYKDLDPRELGFASELYPPIQGMEIVPISSRSYPQKDMAAHVLGRVRQGDPQQATDRKEFFYYVPDQVGINGLEKVYDMTIPESDIGYGAQQGLRGKPGKRTVRVDHRGYIYEQVGFDQPPKNGHDLVLTIDWHAQKIAQELMRDGVDEEKKSPLRGAFVLMDADTGGIISMVSSPTYDLDQMVPKIPTKVWNRLNNDPKKPLINRALSKFTPGSIVKPLVGLALLKNRVNPQETVNCQGKTYISRARIKCMAHHGHQNMEDALMNSCNVYFIEHGQETGMEKITEVFRDAGIGSPTGIVLPEYSGYSPTRESVLEKYKHKWNAFDTGQLSMGQGKIQVTPLQAATFAAAIANGGTLLTPYLLKEVRNPTGAKLYKNKPKPRSKLKVTPKQLSYIRNGMFKVVNSSAKFKARNNFIVLSGKTGSAERETYKKIIVDGKTKVVVDKEWNNTWFIGYGQYQSKRYAFAIFVEHGKYGSVTCAPIAGQFFERWLATKDVK